ncbi:hypothetical protein ALC56_01787 [Trachymyrmex septentrionalis]|uniref:Uncharacterized protein n=1 Tax=Trachymyrmex septentrionalis TaxID=34720 RepID=A0A195FSV6_9HYME|nr:hypothetical protein ALC56_01787 [Trachymyrmex septentrionalis]
MRDIRLYFKSQYMPALFVYVVHHGFCPCERNARLEYAINDRIVRSSRIPCVGYGIVAYGLYAVGIGGGTYAGYGVAGVAPYGIGIPP